MADSNMDRLTAEFRETFEDHTLELSPEMTATDVENWDSFNHINLVIAIETAFDITFATKEIAAMQNVGDLITSLKGNGIDISW